MIEAAVAKATAPLQERIAALEAELAKAKKELVELFQAAVERYRQAEETLSRGRKETKTRWAAGTRATPAIPIPL